MPPLLATGMSLATCRRSTSPRPAPGRTPVPVGAGDDAAPRRRSLTVLRSQSAPGERVLGGLRDQAAVPRGFSNEELPAYLEGRLKTGHAFFEPAHAGSEDSRIQRPCFRGGFRSGCACRRGGYRSRYVCVCGRPRSGYAYGCGRSAMSPRSLLMSWRRDAVQVEHDTDDDGRGYPLGEFR